MRETHKYARNADVWAKGILVRRQRLPLEKRSSRWPTESPPVPEWSPRGADLPAAILPAGGRRASRCPACGTSSGCCKILPTKKPNKTKHNEQKRERALPESVGGWPSFSRRRPVWRRRRRPVPATCSAAARVPSAATQFARTTNSRGWPEPKRRPPRAVAAGNSPKFSTKRPPRDPIRSRP